MICGRRKLTILGLGGRLAWCLAKIPLLANNKRYRYSSTRFFKTVDNQFLYQSKFVGNHCYCTNLPLKITSGGRVWPIAEIHSIKIVHPRVPGCFLNTALVYREPNTKPLDFWPSNTPVSSIFQQFWGLITRTFGRSSLCHHSLITVVVAPFIRCKSMRKGLCTFREGWRFKNA